MRASGPLASAHLPLNPFPIGAVLPVLSHYARIFFDTGMILGTPAALLAVVKFCEEEPRNQDDEPSEDRDQADSVKLAALTARAGASACPACG